VRGLSTHGLREHLMSKGKECRCGERIVPLDGAWAHTSTIIKDSGHCLDGHLAQPKEENDES